MKVAVVSPYAFDAPGGVQDQVRRIVLWLREAGHEAWAVAPGDGGPEGTRHVGEFTLISANRSRAPIALSPRVPARVVRAVQGAEVVHVHEPFMPMVSLGALRRTGTAVVGTFHADPGIVVRALYRGGSRLLRRMARRLQVATAVSEVAAGPVRRFVHVRIVPNGIDLEDYRVGVDREPDRAVFVGRDDPRKGLDFLLQAWPQVRAGSPGATLRVVGVDRAEGPQGVEFLGRVPESRKRRELAEASVLVAPNLGGESFGMVVLEGLAAGCAVVASDLPAFRAVAGEAARYAPPADVNAIAAAVLAALDDGPPGEITASVRGFGREAVLSGYLEAYRDARHALL